MFRSWKLGTAFGIGVYVHWSFLILVAIVMFAQIKQGLGVALFAGVLLVAIFACVVLHEFGHALTARAFGIRTRDITLLPIGGMARMEQPFDRPLEELVITLAGPAVNVVVAMLGFAILLSAGVELPTDRLHDLFGLKRGLLDYPLHEQLLIYLVFTNGFLALFNLLPVFPMDGGRVLRSLLAMGLGQLRATQIAAGLGLAMAVVFIVTGILSFQFLFALLGMFVLMMGQMELAMVRQRAAAAASEPIDVLPASQFLDVSAYPAEPNFSGFTWDRRAGMWVEWRDGRPVHVCRVPHF
jgi:Zn-dependent protease